MIPTGGGRESPQMNKPTLALLIGLPKWRGLRSL